MQTFAAGGKGGQKQNSTNSGVRIIHRESGAMGEARDERSQWANKKSAFERLANSPKFKAWHKLKCAQLMAIPDSLADKDLKIEYYTP